MNMEQRDVAKEAAREPEGKGNRRVFGYGEAVFDVAYLVAALGTGISILSKGTGGPRGLAGAMALLLAFGDAFHLLPRIGAILTGDTPRFHRALGFGKLVTSITMTVFYVLLWHLGTLLFPAVPQGWAALAWALAALRIALCLFPQNGWYATDPSFGWALLRNIPFFLLGIQAIVLFFLHRAVVAPLHWMWLAAALSFAFYLPVALWVGKNPKLGMLMLPKTCMYLWMLGMLAGL